MFSRTSVAFLLPLLCAAILLASCSANVSDRVGQLREAGSGLVKTMQDTENRIGGVVMQVQSGVTIVVDGVKQIQSGATKISQGKEVMLGAGSEVVK